MRKWKSAISYPYENTLVAFHLVITAAYNPMTRAEQSNNMWKPSDISPKLLVHTPYTSSTNVNIWKINIEVIKEPNVLWLWDFI